MATSGPRYDWSPRVCTLQLLLITVYLHSRSFKSSWVKCIYSVLLTNRCAAICSPDNQRHIKGRIINKRYKTNTGELGSVLYFPAEVSLSITLNPRKPARSSVADLWPSCKPTLLKRDQWRIACLASCEQRAERHVGRNKVSDALKHKVVLYSSCVYMELMTGEYGDALPKS